MWFEIIGRAATPVHNVLVLAFTAQLTIPVGDTQVVVHQRVAHVTVPEYRVEERLGRKGRSESIICAVLCNTTKTVLGESQVTVKRQRRV